MGRTGELALNARDRYVDFQRIHNRRMCVT
jgi:hypothetical protein